uniref:TSA: Wollemia nobilis Ref_Wollemi_Transcript_7699_723 transcribed RNA sequence n=1 Tax=Wollemia nobilis TaxID=56998 RepID=A0A0C9S7T2_9CONI
MTKRVEDITGFEDYLPLMAENLGEEEFMEEICNGFRLLADAEKGVITVQSLQRNASLLGIEAMSEDELRAMIEAGDIDGNGVVDQQEFCILMVRISPSLMGEAQKWLENALVHEHRSFVQ